MDLSGFPDLKGVACSPGNLSHYLLFPEGTNVAEVSRALCDINDSKIPDITDFLLRQLDVAEVIRLVGLAESVGRCGVTTVQCGLLQDLSQLR